MRRSLNNLLREEPKSKNAERPKLKLKPRTINDRKPIASQPQNRRPRIDLIAPKIISLIDTNHFPLFERIKSLYYKASPPPNMIDYPVEYISIHFYTLRNQKFSFGLRMKFNDIKEELRIEASRKNGMYSCNANCTRISSNNISDFTKAHMVQVNFFIEIYNEIVNIIDANYSDSFYIPNKAVIKGGSSSQFIHIPNYGKRKVRYQKNGRPYVIVNKKKLKL